MARTRTLSNLRSDVRQRADMENTTFVTDAEVTEYINQSIADLRDLLIEHQGPEHFMSSSTAITTASGTASYALPADFYEMVAVRVDVGGPSKLVALPYSIDEHDVDTSAGDWGWHRTSEGRIRYRIVGDNIYFYPIPNGAYPVKIWYLPAATRLVQPADEFDGYNGFEEWVILDAAIKCLIKEESDISALLALRERQEQRIARAAGRRDQGGPSKIRDTSQGRWR